MKAKLMKAIDNVRKKVKMFKSIIVNKFKLWKDRTFSSEKVMLVEDGDQSFVDSDFKEDVNFSNEMHM